MAGKKKVKISSDEQKLKEMKEMETVPLVEKDTRQINLSTSWIFFAITLFFITMTITLLYNLTGQIADLKESMNTRFEIARQHLNTVTIDLKSSMADQAADIRSSQTPFCSGYDQNGQLGFWVDGRKVTSQCEWVTTTTTPQ